MYRQYVGIGFCAFASAPLIAPIIDQIMLSQVYYQVGESPNLTQLIKRCARRTQYFLFDLIKAFDYTESSHKSGFFPENTHFPSW